VKTGHETGLLAGAAFWSVMFVSHTIWGEATKIATLSENYRHTQEQVTTIHSILIGS
jgi:hypothetical protein